MLCTIHTYWDTEHDIVVLETTNNPCLSQLPDDHTCRKQQKRSVHSLRSVGPILLLAYTNLLQTIKRTTTPYTANSCSVSSSNPQGAFQPVLHWGDLKYGYSTQNRNNSYTSQPQSLLVYWWGGLNTALCYQGVKHLSATRE